MQATCPACATEVGAGDNFCGACGTSLQPVAATPASVESADGGVATRVVDVPVDDAPTDLGVEPEEAHTTVLSAVTGGVDLVECPDCDAFNAAQRTHCARCGNGLAAEADATPEAAVDAADRLPSRQAAPLREPLAEPVAARVLPATTAPGAAVVRGPIARVPLWAWVVLVGVIVGGIVGLATAGGVGATPTGPVYEFDAAAYPDTTRLLMPAQVGGSSTREVQDGRRFAGTMVLDGDLATAWSPDFSDGRVEFLFARPVWIMSLEFANGDQLDEETFEATGRVRTLLVDFGDGQVVEATLIDGQGRQVVRLPQPMLTDHVVLAVEQATGGTGVALSEVVFSGHLATTPDADLVAEA